MNHPWQLKGDQLTLHCHVQPGARQNKLAGLYDNCLKIQLQSPPVDGKANQALIAFLAKQFSVPKSSITLKSGHSSRRKTLLIQPVSELPAAITQLQSELS